VNPVPRGSLNYTFTLPEGCGGSSDQVKVARLMGNGSDAVSGITFAGVSYNYELAGGTPVVLKNVTGLEVVGIQQGGKVGIIQVPDSSAVVLELEV